MGLKPVPTRGTAVRTVGVVFVHPDNAIFISSNDGEFAIGEEEICVRDAYTVDILGQKDEFVWFLLWVVTSTTI